MAINHKALNRIHIRWYQKRWRHRGHFCWWSRSLAMQELALLLLILVTQELAPLFLILVAQENHLFGLLLLVAVIPPQPLHSLLALP
jgi:hypothetical protein